MSVPLKSRRNLIGVVVLVMILPVALMLAFGKYDVYTITSASMIPTLMIGDDVAVRHNDSYVPARGDVVVIDSPEGENHLTKRIIALGGDTIKIEKGIVWLNGDITGEVYIADENRDREYGFEEIVVPEGHLFVLGDNRNNSVDSREFGTIPTSSVRGQLAFVYSPLARMGSVR